MPRAALLVEFDHEIERTLRIHKRLGSYWKRLDNLGDLKHAKEMEKAQQQQARQPQLEMNAAGDYYALNLEGIPLSIVHTPIVILENLKSKFHYWTCEKNMDERILSKKVLFE